MIFPSPNMILFQISLLFDILDILFTSNLIQHILYHLNSCMSTKMIPLKSASEQINIEPLIQQKQQNSNSIPEDPSLEQEPPPSTLKQLFQFADKIDLIFMGFAFLFSFGNGVSIIFYSFPLKQLIDAFSTTQSKQQIVQATLGSVYGFLTNSAIVFLNCWLMTAAWTITSERQMNRARKEYFSALLKQELSWHDRSRPEEICAKMYAQIGKVQQGLVKNMTAVLTKVSMGGSGIIVALTIGYNMAIVMILFLPVMLLSGLIQSRFLKGRQMYSQTKKVRLDSDIIQVFDNIKTVKMLSGEQYQLNRYQKNLLLEKQINWSNGWKSAIGFTIFFFCITANYALGFWYGTKLVADQTINSCTGQLYTVAQVVAIFFTIYVSNLNLNGLPPAITSFSVSRYSMAKILTIVNRQPKMIDGDQQFPNQVKCITFNNISFKYDKPLFDNLYLTIDKGITALIGQSGCGKSTIVSLLMRFYDVQKGEIILSDGNELININSIKNESLKKNIGYVGQQPILIGKSVKQILMAQQYSDNQIFSLLRTVKAESFVRSIGLTTQLKSVSGGQKQRLAIARALLKKPKILILDESTSALDQKTQQEVLTNISKMGIQFIVMVAHRQETLTYADHIIKISKEKIQFSGTYKQLIEEGLMNKLTLQSVEQQRKSQLKSPQNEIQQQCDQSTQKLQKLEQTQTDIKQQQKKDEQEKYSKLTFKWKYLVRLLQLNRDKWFLYVLGLIGSLYFGSIFPTFSYLISRIILILQNIAAADQSTLPIYQHQAHILATCLFLVSFGSLIFTTLKGICFQYLTQQAGYKIKLRAFGELLNRSYAEIEKDGAQNYSYMINKNCQDVKPLAGTTIPTIIENLTTLIVGLFIAFYFSWEITLISLVIMPLILLSSKMLMSFNHGMQNITDSTHRRTHQLVTSTIINLKTVRSCLLQKRIQEKYAQELDKAMKYSIKYGNLSGVLFGVGQTLISCSLAAVFFAGACLIRAQVTTVQDIYTAMFAVMFAGVQAGGNLYFLGQLAANKIGLCVYQQQIIKNGQVEKQYIIENDDDFDIFQDEGGSLQIQNIEFDYPNRPTPVFQNFNLKITKNQKIAIVGQSGAGKSTLTSLLFKLYQPQSGSIYVNGFPLHQMSMSKVSKVMGIVMQQPALFNRSVFQNIKYNYNGANNQDIQAACVSAKAYDFIEQGNFGLTNEEEEKQNISKIEQAETLPKGFFKFVGPKGNFLSGGQKQRVSIARALTRKPKILILDQATSALDPENQRSIQQTLETITNVTQIIIAHRLSTIVHCDRIVVLKNGKIVQQGTYKELIEKGGYFFQLTQSYQQNK